MAPLVLNSQNYCLRSVQVIWTLRSESLHTVSITRCQLFHPAKIKKRLQIAKTKQNIKTLIKTPGESLVKTEIKKVPHVQKMVMVVMGLQGSWAS